MNKNTKNEELVNNIVHQSHFIKGDLVTLSLKIGYSKEGGELLKGDRISEKHLIEYFHSGNEYIFCKRNGDKVLLQYRCQYGKIESYIWVDVSEIYLPFQKQKDEELKDFYQCDDDSVEFQIKVPTLLTYTFKDWENQCNRFNYITKYRTPYNGKVYEFRFDIPIEHRHSYGCGRIKESGYEEFTTPIGITDFQIEMWKSFNSDMKESIIDFTREVETLFDSRITTMVQEKIDDVIENRKNYENKY
jgi:hypothetical protein